MATDVAPALLAAIQSDFQRRVDKSGAEVRMANRIRDGTASLDEVHSYAQQIGEILSDSLLANLIEDALPDGRLYWNIANRTIRPMLKNNYLLVNEAAKAVQKKIDDEMGLGLNALAGEFLEDRIDRLIGGAAEAETFEQMQVEIGEPVINCSESFFDDFVQANAEFREQAGLQTRVVRTAAANCCPWCADLVGEYSPQEARSEGVYRRHLFCRCTVTYESGRHRQEVWSKRSWMASSAQLNERKTAGLDVLRMTPGEAAALSEKLSADRIARDQQVISIMKSRRVSREQAVRIYNKSNKRG